METVGGTLSFGAATALEVAKADAGSDSASRARALGARRRVRVRAEGAKVARPAFWRC
jgi:hypothetical protein